MFNQSNQIEAKVNEYAENVAKYQGWMHRDCDTVFLGFNIEIFMGDTLVTAIYEADGYKIGVEYCDGEWIVEDCPALTFNFPA